MLTRPNLLVAALLALSLATACGSSDNDLFGDGTTPTAGAAGVAGSSGSASSVGGAAGSSGAAGSGASSQGGSSATGGKATGGQGGSGGSGQSGTGGSSPEGGAGGTETGGSPPEGGSGGSPPEGGSGGSPPEGGSSGTSGQGGAPEGGAAGAPEGGAAGAPEGGAAGAPEGGTGGAPEGGAAGAPEGGTGGAPEGGAAGAPEGGTGGAPEGGAAGAPEGGASGAGGEPAAVCGDGAVQPGEQCDDGNQDNADGCTNECKVQCPSVSNVKLNPANSHCYWVLDQGFQANWSQRRDQCASKGGHLATIANPEEDKFIQGIHKEDAWIGATDGKNKKESGAGTYGWITQEPFDYINWAGGEPNAAEYWFGCDPFAKCYEHCAVQLTNGQWNDRSCDAGLDAICEWEPPGAP